MLAIALFCIYNNEEVLIAIYAVGFGFLYHYLGIAEIGIGRILTPGCQDKAAAFLIYIHLGPAFCLHFFFRGMNNPGRIHMADKGGYMAVFFLKLLPGPAVNRQYMPCQILHVYAFKFLPHLLAHDGLAGKQGIQHNGMNACFNKPAAVFL